MANIIYSSFKEFMADGTMDLDNDTFKIALVTSSYTPSADHTEWADVSSNEASGSGYTAGGAALNSTWTRSGATVTFDADDVTWSSATVTGRYAVIYNDTATNDELVCLLDFGEDKSSSNADFKITFNASGIFSLS